MSATLSPPWKLSLTPITVTYDPIYDELSRPLSEMACWDKDTGLGDDHGKHIQANVPCSMIIAIDTISSPKSAGCMSCWILEYEDRARPFLALDHADSGFVVSLGGMNSLTAGKAERLGRIDANATEVELLNCGLHNPPEREL